MGVRAASIAWLTAIALAAAPASAGAPALPNLVPLPAFDVRIASADDSPTDTALRFSVATANRGDFAFDLFGEPEDVLGRTAVAHQCVDWATDRVCAARAEVGRFSWHAEHGHMHLDDFALYELRRFRRDGRPKMTDQGLVASSGKVSYCIIDSDAEDDSRGLLYMLPHPLYYSCFVGGFQGISPGWADVYTWRTHGQQLLVNEVPDGRYALVVAIDPAERLMETSDEDNTSVTGIRLYRDGSEVEVVCKAESPSQPCLPR